MAPILQGTITADANLASRPPLVPLIAPLWHTIVFIAIFVGLSVAGGFFQHAAKQHPQGTVTAPSRQVVTGYISVTVFEWLLVFFVRRGVHKREVRLRDLIGSRWATPKAVIFDIALAAGLWAVWTGLMSSHLLGGGTNAAHGLLPQGLLQSIMWMPVALSAGFCEELAFRGHLQKQFQAITGSIGWAVLIQAIVFGIGHLYEGVGPVARIMLFGGLSPNSGLVGTSVTIVGAGFGSPQGSGAVVFNPNVAATVSSWADNQIVVTVPTGATTGNITVTVSGGSSASKKFTVN